MDTGSCAAVHRSLCCLLEETGQAASSRYGIIAGILFEDLENGELMVWISRLGRYRQDW